ncbi:hypothetical protein DY000_02061538 [Brassica cretica]|uniref:Aminotransferase-like plant mobile domain-containing protein n=1 Tax=Brassica cretica TaxID=69181 RepID=A0ABQ7AUN8_BRACR|nr:hypothetical protein DY000_02061538 [Brassica cretica]
MNLQDSSPLPLLKLDPEKMSEGPSLEERITPTAALKSTGSSFDLFFTALYLSFEPGAQQPNGLRLIQPVLAIHEELQLAPTYYHLVSSPTISPWPEIYIMCRLWIKQEYTSCVGSDQQRQSLLLCLDLMMDGDNTCIPETSLKLQQESDHTH